jgi:hypothetical protein
VNSREAKEILLLYRPRTADANDPEFSEALALAKKDPELATWFEQHCTLQTAVMTGFDRIKPPEGLLEQILSERKTASAVPDAHDQRPAALTTRSDRNGHSSGRLAVPSAQTRQTFTPRRATLLAGAFATLLVLAGALVLIRQSPSTNDFAAFRRVMTSKVSRIGLYPHMDLETRNLAEIRQHLAQHDGQSGYSLPPALEQTPGTGCATFKWHNKKVSMICFSSKGLPRDPDLYLFVIDKSSLGSAPADTPEFAQAGSLSTASWTSGDKSYLLAAAGDQDFLRKHL